MTRFIMGRVAAAQQKTSVSAFVRKALVGLSQKPKALALMRYRNSACGWWISENANSIRPSVPPARPRVPTAAFIDTNILLYAASDGRLAPEKTRLARLLLRGRPWAVSGRWFKSFT